MQQSPWKTTSWKNIRTKQELSNVKVIPFSNFCDGTEFADLQLQKLLKSPSFSLNPVTFQEVILRALLLHLGKDSVFASPAAVLHPVNCVNLLISTSSGNDFFCFKLTFSVVLNHSSHWDETNFRILTTICHTIDRYISWNTAKECYFFLFSSPSVHTFHSFAIYLQRINELYIQPRVTVTETLPIPSTNSEPVELENFPLVGVENHTLLTDHPISLLACLSKGNPLDNVDDFSHLLQTGFESSISSELLCFQRVTLFRIAVNVFR